VPRPAVWSGLGESRSCTDPRSYGGQRLLGRLVGPHGMALGRNCVSVRIRTRGYTWRTPRASRTGG
jgi:hypothetical protein